MTDGYKLMREKQSTLFSDGLIDVKKVTGKRQLRDEKGYVRGWLGYDCAPRTVTLNL